MPELAELINAVETLTIQNGKLRTDVKLLRTETSKKVSAAVTSSIIVGIVGLISFIAAITSLFVFRSFKDDINHRTVAACNNFNADRLDQRNGLKTLLRGLIPVGQENNPATIAYLSHYDALVDNGWRLRDCTPSGIVEYQANNHPSNLTCKTDGKGFCVSKPVPPTSSTTSTTVRR